LGKPPPSGKGGLLAQIFRITYNNSMLKAAAGIKTENGSSYTHCLEKSLLNTTGKPTGTELDRKM
jgi:hypothetical protein